jgi:glycosyltransferase involved in cell wall biosynthesis
MTSREEGGPLALLESLASGVPVVSTRTGMAEDVIEDGGNGALVEVDDVDGMVERAGALLADSSQADAFRRHGLAVAESHRWDRVAARLYDEVYKPLLAEATLSRNQR